MSLSLRIRRFSLPLTFFILPIVTQSPWRPSSPHPPPGPQLRSFVCPFPPTSSQPTSGTTLASAQIAEADRLFSLVQVRRPFRHRPLDTFPAVITCLPIQRLLFDCSDYLALHPQSCFLATSPSSAPSFCPETLITSSLLCSLLFGGLPTGILGFLSLLRPFRPFRCAASSVLLLWDLLSGFSFL